MKQTAIEWLEKNIWEHIEYKPPLEIQRIRKTIEQAKEMEKERLMHAYGQGVADEAGEIIDATKDAEEYYNRTYNQNNIDDKKLKITFTEYGYSCGDGCCYNSGTITTVNGVELPLHNDDGETIAQQILEHLGYKVEVEYIYDLQE
jgi:hypothetical protein